MSNLADTLTNYLSADVEHSLSNNDSEDDGTLSSRLLLLVELISAALFSNGITSDWTSTWANLLPTVFALSRLLPNIMNVPSLQDAASLWSKALPLLNDNTRAVVKGALQERLADLVVDTSTLSKYAERFI